MDREQIDIKNNQDSSVKETKELTEIKINASNPSKMSIPTEIFIEDPVQLQVHQDHHPRKYHEHFQ